MPLGERQNIRVADDLLIDLLFAANGQSHESLRDHIRALTLEGVQLLTLYIAGLLKTKTGCRDKDRIDREASTRLLAQLQRLLAICRSHAAAGRCAGLIVCL